MCNWYKYVKEINYRIYLSLRNVLIRNFFKNIGKILCFCFMSLLKKIINIIIFII